ncbi:MAG: polysaccharide deacetylase family protein [Nocardioides sp.]|nr:polysaccharide deacetylase family protein [Nocardioides sp.]
MRPVARLVLPLVLLVTTTPTVTGASTASVGSAAGVQLAAAAAGPCRSGTVSLTFDDGPSPNVTPRLVRILKDLNAPATFFMVGQRVDAAPSTARLVGRSGFLVANHSYAHANMTRQSSGDVRRTLRATARSMRRAGLQPTRLMRPPYGAIDARVRRAVAAEGHVPVLWDVDPRDWEGGSSATIADRILAQLRPHGSNIVLQHDGIGNSPASVGAVPRVVREARQRGYCFVALDESGRPGFPTPHAEVSATSVAEGTDTTVTIRLGRPTARVTSVRLRTRSGTAVAGRDFGALDTRVRIPAGVTTVQVPIAVPRDRLDEPTERFRVVISRPRGLVVDRGRAVVVVTDRDPKSGVSGVDVSVAEPASGSRTVRVRFKLGRVSGRIVRLRVVPVASTAGSDDVSAAPATLTIPAGRRSATIAVSVLADTVDEGVERFRLRIVGALNAQVVRRDAVVTITPPEMVPQPAPRR